MMKKGLIYIFRIFLIAAFVISIFPPMNVYADDNTTIGDLKRKYQNLLAEQRENENKTAAAKAEIAKKEAAINKANADISAAEDAQEEAQQAIEESNENINELTLESEKILLYMQQMQGQNAYVEYVTGASSMTELTMRLEAVKQVTSYIQDAMYNLEDEIEKNETLKLELQEKQKNLENQIVSYQSTIAKYYSNIDEYDAFAEDIDTKVATAKKDYETNLAVCNRNLGKENVKDTTKLSECSKVPVNSGWLKPLNSGVVSSGIGYRTHPVSGVRYSFHNALDLAGNKEGTPVYAAAAGQVIAIQYHTSCGGNRVYIYSYVNGKYYTHYYYHLLRYNVKVGDIVDQNTVIGYVGGGSGTPWDSCSTGAHLHFGMAEGRHANHTTNVLMKLPGFGGIGYRWSSRTAYYGG